MWCMAHDFWAARSALHYFGIMPQQVLTLLSDIFTNLKLSDMELVTVFPPGSSAKHRAQIESFCFEPEIHGQNCRRKTGGSMNFHLVCRPHLRGSKENTGKDGLSYPRCILLITSSMTVRHCENTSTAPVRMNIRENARTAISLPHVLEPVSKILREETFQ